MLKQGNVLAVDYEREFLWLNRYDLELVPIEEEICKQFFREMRDELRVQLVLHKFKIFVDIVEREKMVEQAMGLDKKVENFLVFGKRVETISSQPLPKWARKS